MALHSELPIYKVAYDLLCIIVQLVRSFPRDARQDIGSALRQECVRITVLIFRANVARDKAVHLAELIERKEVAELLLRLSHDLRFISPKQYSRAIELTAAIGRQANGWRKKFPPAT